MANVLHESSKYLAQNIVSLRKKLNLTQNKLAALSGATRASIALIESGSSNPTLDVLLKISNALEVSLNELMSPPRADCKLIPSKDVPIKTRKGIVVRKILPDKAGATDIDEMILEAGATFPGTPHIEGTKEYFTCIEGEVTISVLGQIYKLKAGDVLTFPGDKPHAYKNSGRSKARGFSVVLFRPV
jgi:XRE family transcriptional regulator, regulator of sulfur utilization